MIQMHRWDDVSLGFLLDQGFHAILRALLGQDPYAVQTMLYFKRSHNKYSLTQTLVG